MKNSNFKKVLALILSVAMVLSVCLTGLTVSAETAEVDLSCAIVNDTTIKTWRANHENVVLANYEGKTLYRVAPQTTKRGLLPLSSKVELTAEQAATVNTIAYYVGNEIGSDLELGFQYYGSDGTYNAFLGSGYAYLLDVNSGEILPITSNKGYYFIPAGFKGYVIFDLSKAENYGNGDWDVTEGTPVKAVDAFKDNCFKPLMLRAVYTEDMIGKAWYVGDLTVSTKNVEDFAESLSGLNVVTFNFNTASVKGYSVDNAVNFWNTNGKFDSDENGTAELVEFGSFEGIGSKFTLAITPSEIPAGYSKGNDGALGLNNAYVDSIGKDLPFSMENAKGMVFQVKKEGNVSLALAINSNRNGLKGTYTLVSDSGAVTTGASQPPANFSGTAYFIFSDLAVAENYASTGTKSWADYVKSLTGDFNLNIYAGDKGVKGDTITFGGFSFIYDTTDLVAKITPEIESDPNPILRDGTENPKSFDGGTGSYRNDWDVKSDGSKVKAVFVAPTTSTLPNNLYFNKSGKFYEITAVDVADINGLSFEYKVPDDGNTHTLEIYLDTTNKNYYHGGIVALDKDGTIAFERDYASWNKATKGKVTLPSGFDGTIILTGTATEGNHAWSAGYVGEASHVTYATFAEYYAVSNKFRGLSLFVATSAESYVAGDTYEYDNLRVITQDMDSYIADVQSEYASANKEANDALLNGDGYIVNDFSNTNGNTMSIPGVGATNGANISYATDENDTAYAGKIKFSTSPKDGQRRLAFKVNSGSLDLSNVVGFTYKVNITDPDNYSFKNSYQIHHQKYAITTPTVYVINDDTGAITEATEFNSKGSMNATVVVLFNEKVAVTGGYADQPTDPTYTWSEFLAEVGGTVADVGLWIKTNRSVAETIYGEDGTTVESVVLTEACDNFEMLFDDLAFISAESSIVKEIEARYDTEKYFAPMNDLTNKTFGVSNSFTDHTGNAGYDFKQPFTVTIDDTVNTPAGTAFKFTRVETELTKTHEFKVANRSGLTNDELKQKEAIAYWVKVPAGETLKIVGDGIGGQSAQIRSSLMTYDVVTNKAQLIAGDGAITLNGFEGYVIIPLQNALVKTGTPLSYSDFIDANGLSQLYFFMSSGAYKGITTAFWMGEFQFVDSLSGFMDEIGAETKAGDANGDGEVDIRDTVRIKKFNADAMTAIAYQNMDIDGNGLIETNIDMAASRKQNLGVDYKAPELDSSLAKQPDVMAGFYHGDYGQWDYYASDIAAESDVLNTYTGADVYALTQMKQNGGAGWFYFSRTCGGEPVFGSKEGGYDSTATELNPAWITAIDDAMNIYKEAGVWNQFAGFYTDEILSNEKMTNSQFATATAYLRETYGKRILAVLSTYEVNGTDTLPAADVVTYANVTDIGFNMYQINTDDRKNSYTGIFNAMKANIGNRTDIKYWVLPTAYCYKTEDGAPNRTDADIATEIAWFDDFFADTTLIPENQRGGILFYTFRTFYDGGYDYPATAGNFGSFGLDKLISEYNYTLTAKAIADMTAKYVK